jgi:RimJ/RimL family protein N-acetyltransferase
LVLAENQRASAEALAQARAVAAVNKAEEIGPLLSAVLADPIRVAQMSAAAFAIVDGNGTSRVTAALLGHERQRSGEVQLRPATMDDAEQLWLWRNDPVTRSQSRNTDPITWSSHLKWLRAAFADAQRQIIIATRDGTPIGNIGVHPVADGKEVSIVVAPTDRGNGNGRAMLQLACGAATEPLFASVRTDNLASRRLFESCGFHLIDSREPGFLRYCRSHDQGVRKRA